MFVSSASLGKAGMILVCPHIHVGSEVRTHLQASRAEMASQQHRQAHLTTLMSGDLVMKLITAKFLGPFTIITKMHDNKFEIMHNATDAIETGHNDRLDS